MVPNGWEEKPLIKLLDKIIDYRGQSVPKADNGIPLITARNVRFGYLDFSNQEYVDESEFENWMSRGIPDVGDILFTTEAPLGMACRFPEKGRYAVAQRTVTLRTSNRLHSDFLLYFLLSEHGQRLIDIRSSGSTAKGIKSAELKKVKLLHPTCINEQQKIAKILSTWDKAISTTERLIDNSIQQKKALMQQLLTGKQRLLDESGKRFEGDWEKLKLEDVVIKTQLGTSERTKDVEETSTIPLIKMGNLTWGGFSFDKLETLPKSKVDESLILKSGDFLFNTRNTPELVGKSAVWKEQQIEATFDNNINRITFNRNVDTDFICLYLTYGKGKSLISSLSAGSTSVAAIYWKDLKNIKLPLPTLSEQQKIATVLTNADKEIELLEQQLADLQQEKKALMQVLLTGKKRVVVGCDTDNNEG